MTKKRIQPGSTHGFIGDLPKRKTKPREIDNTWIEPYWLKRDKIIFETTNNEQTKEDILNRYEEKQHFNH